MVLCGRCERVAFLEGIVTGDTGVETLIRLIQWLDVIVFVALVILSLRQWRAGGGAAVGWLTATFAVLAFAIVAGVVTPEDSDETGLGLLERLILTTLVLFPYFLFRFAAALKPADRFMELAANGLTIACVVASFLVPMVPEEGGDLRPGVIGFIALLLGQWTLLSSFTAIRLWRMGSGQPAVARHRMRLLSVASVLLNMAFVLASVTSSVDSVALSLFIQLIAAASGLSFFIGFAPPYFVRMLWRREDQEELRRATVKLMVATSSDEVTASILPHVAAIVGGRAAALLDQGNRVMDTHGVSDEMRQSIPALLEGGVRESGFAQDMIVVDAPFGKLIVWGAPATPIFGQEEIEFLQSLSVFTGLALERTELFQRERKARRSLERSNRELESASAELEQEIAERRRAEEGLIESQTQLAEAQELTMLGSWSWDVEKDRIQWSDQMFRIYGVDQADFTADFEGFISLVHPDDREAVRAVVDKLRVSDDSFNVDHRVVRSDGKIRVMHARGKVMRDVSGRPLRVIGTSQDITRRRQAEKSLRDSEARFRTLAESANEGIVSIDSRGMIVFWNGGAQDIFGYWEDEVRGQEVQMLMPERYRADHKRGLARFLDTGEGRIVGTTIELEGLRKDGTEFPLELSLSTWMADEQRFFTGVLRDVSDRRATEQELELVNRRQQLILNAAGEGIYGIGPDGLTQFVNPAAAAMLGYEVHELIGRALHQVIHHSRVDESSYPIEECPIHLAMRDGTVERVGDEVFWRKDGTAVSIEYVVSPIIEDDVVTGGVVVFWERSSGAGMTSGLRYRAHPVS